MKVKQKVAALILCGIFGMVTQVNAQIKPMAEMPQMPAGNLMVMPSEIVWGPGPPGLPPGSQSAVLEGDPSKPELFVLRAKIPAGWKVMPHTHPCDEHITVIDGNCFMGMGNKYDEKVATEMPTGGFMNMKTGTVHYFFTKKACIIQIQDMGPWGITYVNSADDPRNKK